MAEFVTANIFFITLGAIAFSTGLMFLIRKGFGLQSLRYHHEVSDPLLTCVGTLFAVLLGFLVANAMTRYDQARVNIEQEAGAVGDIFRLSTGLPKEQRDKIETDCLNYCNVVIQEGWKELAKHEMNEHAWNAYGQLWQDALSFEPAGNRLSNIHQAMLGACTRLGEARRIRATQLKYHLPGILWVVVILGAVATGMLALFFGMQNAGWQVITNSLVTLILCLNLFLLASYDDPFSGYIALQPVSFEVTRDSIIKVRAHRYVGLR